MPPRNTLVVVEGFYGGCEGVGGEGGVVGIFGGEGGELWGSLGGREEVLGMLQS